MKREWQVLVLPLAVIAFSVGSASAARLSRGTSDAYTIEHESGAGRILFRANLVPEEENVLVRRALVRVPLGSVEFSRHMILRIHPVTTPWTAGQVSWTTGWSRDGGDFDDALWGRAEVFPSSAGVATFDITVIAKEMLEHGMANYGFILTIDPDEGVGLPASDLDALDALSGATVQVDWRRKPALRANVDS